jgi:hypothetical protein
MTSVIRKAPTWAVPCADSYAFVAVSDAALAAPVVRVRELAVGGPQAKQGWSVFTGTNPIAPMAHPNVSGPDPGGPPV